MKFTLDRTEADKGKKPESDHQVGTALLDTIEVRPIAGSGRCKSCGCKGYRPNNPKNDYCKDCGHSWYMHENAG
jgi:hypothetical protein